MRRIAIWSIWLWPHALVREGNGHWRMHGPRGRRRLGWRLTVAAAWVLAIAWPWGAPGRWGQSCRRHAPFWWWDRAFDAVLRRGLAGLLAWLWPDSAFHRHSWRRRLPAGTIAAILMGVTAVAAPNMTPRGEGELGAPRIDRMGTGEGGGAHGAGGAGTDGTPLLELAGLTELPGSLAGGAAGGSGAGQGGDNAQQASNPTDTGNNDPEKPTDEPSPPPGEQATGEFYLPTGLMNGGSVAGGPVYGGLGGGGSGSGGSAGGGGGSGGGSGGGTTPGDSGDPGATTPSDPPPLVEPPGEGGQPGSDPDGGVTIFDPPRQPLTPDEPFTPDGPGPLGPPSGDPRDNPGLLPVVEPRDPTPEGHDELTGVPEPAAWLLMMLGFGAIGASLRRRRPTVLQR